MQINFSESANINIADSILGNISDYKNLGDLAKDVECMDFYIYYHDDITHKETFKICYAGNFYGSELDRFLKYEKLAKVKLLTDHYDIKIQSDEFESECFVFVRKLI